jgi:hypothetical protein
MVMTIQRADLGQYGEGYKVAPLSTYKVRNLMSCFKMPGFSEAPVDIQVTLPDLTGFQVILLACTFKSLEMARFLRRAMKEIIHVD